MHQLPAALLLLLQLLLLLLLLFASESASTLGPSSIMCKTLHISQHASFKTHPNATLLQQHLRHRVAGCQYVSGDVVLKDIGVDAITEQALNASREVSSDFLDSIVEISGKLTIFRVNLRVLEFKELRAIRGYNVNALDPFYSIEVVQAKYPMQLRFPRLGAVLGGNVHLTGAFNVQPYCHLARTVDWSNLLQSAAQREIDNVIELYDSAGRSISVRNYKEVQRACSEVAVCNSSCATNAAGKPMCWSASAAGCQRRIRCSQRDCYSAMCFTDDRNQEDCCHSECLGGCSGRGPADCASCRGVNFNGSCTSQCPKSSYYDEVSGTMKTREKAMLRVGNICTAKCPATFVQSLDSNFCLNQCPTGEIPVEAASQAKCAKCSSVGSSSTCELCEVKGIFSDDEAASLRKSGCNFWKVKSALTVRQESINNTDATLRTLQQALIVYSNLYIRNFDRSLTNLYFLRNLKHVSSNVLLMNLHVRYLALAKLRSAKVLYLSDVSGLCSNWLPLTWLQQQKLYPFKSTKIQFDNSSSECQSAACDTECLNGCWGPGPQLCVECRNVSVNGTCFPSCREAGSYGFNSSGVVECRSCHPECAGGCSGASPANCNACRHFRQDQHCVPACSSGLQPDSDRVCVVAFAAKLWIIGPAVAAVLLLLLLLLLSAAYYRRRIHKYDMVDLDEYLADPDNDNDMTRLLLVNNDDLVKQKEIGSGAFGTVYRGLLRTVTHHSGVKQLPVAIKVLRGCSQQLDQELLREAGVLARVQHQHCIRLVALCLTEEVQLITALMPRGCLLDFLHERRGKLGAARMLSWAQQVAQGMQYLHSLDIVHRDLAARNVLLQTPDLVKITDFGLARLLQQQQLQQPAASLGAERLPVKWLGVEYFDSGHFSHQSDVWSYGVLLWEICTFGESPYASSGAQSAEEICALLRNGRRLPQPPTCSVDFYNIMLSCWLPQPQSRPTFKELDASMAECLEKPNRFIASAGAGLKPEPDTDDLRMSSVFNWHIYTSEPTAAAAAAAASAAGKQPVNIYVPDPADSSSVHSPSPLPDAGAEIRGLLNDDYLVPRRSKS